MLRGVIEKVEEVIVTKDKIVYCERSTTKSGGK
jgi:hypothetical protein